MELSRTNKSLYKHGCRSSARASEVIFPVMDVLRHRHNEFAADHDGGGEVRPRGVRQAGPPDVEVEVFEWNAQGDSFPDDYLCHSGMDLDDVSLHLYEFRCLRDESEAVRGFMEGHVSIGGDGELQDSGEDVGEPPQLLGGGRLRLRLGERAELILDGDVTLSGHCLFTKRK
ncbi:hypothetical protein V8G54_013979 [Vigna mungo]|uniref:Uncharacterized protein n=1 Tax=Vigna mungo TaxID=3915 RepID=A0AAQ3NFV3_VIGMU